jgi:uncharacterized protein
MITVHIQGMHDGVHPFSIETPVERIDGFPTEFVESVLVDGEISKMGRRFHIDATLEGLARLVCDRSLEEFDERIRVEIALDVIIDAERASRGSIADDDVLVIRDDDKVVNITDVVRQELLVNLPMRRVAPAYRNKELTEVFPNLANRDASTEQQTDTIDERWEVLRSLRKP